MSKRMLSFFSVLIFTVMLLGCGGGSSEVISSLDNDLYNSKTVTVSGNVIDGTNESTRTAEARYSLNNDLAGIQVHIEGRKELCATTDSNGKFVINKVPVGIRSFIAEKKEMGAIAYRQRLASINIKESKDTFELTTPISIVSSPYSNAFVVKDPMSGKPVPFAKAVIWDTEYTADNQGKLSITNFPAINNISAKITASNYKPYTAQISFGENIKVISEINMTKTSSSNVYPVVSIKYGDTSAIRQDQGKLMLEPDTYINLEAIGYDPDDLNTSLTWNWSATSGKFNGNVSNSSIMYMVPNNISNKVTITLTGKDKQRLSSHASLEFYVNNKKSQDENKAPYPVTNISPENNAQNVPTAQSILFKWYCLGDPDPDDTVTYQVYLKTNDSDFVSIGKTENQQLTYLSTISANTKYSWYVTATDQSGLATKSETWSFVTEKIDEITITTPNAVTEPLKLQFAKAVDVAQTDLTSIETFIPPMAVEVKWSNDNKTVECMPANGSWYPGSYNAVNIDENKITFTDGKKNATSILKRFELPSEIPVPEGYRSYAFPMKLKANEQGACIIPFLSKNKNAYALILNDNKEITKGYISGASAELNKIVNDPTYQYRVQEFALQNRQAPDLVLYGKNSSARASLKQHKLDEIRDFFVDTGTSQYPQIVRTALADFNDKVLIYADINIIPSAENAKRIKSLLNQFSDSNGILETNEQYFGKAPQCGPDGEDRLAIVLYEPPQYVLVNGYFTGIDFYYNDPQDPALLSSNACKAVYLNFNRDNTQLKATLAHEFQHMIYFYHKGIKSYEENNYRNNPQDTWLNEGMSKIAEEINGFDINNNSNTASWIRGSQENINKLSLTNWDGQTYGIAYLFMRYLTQPGRYKSTIKEVTNAIIASGRQESTRDIERITNEPFKTTLAKWALSLYINDYKSTNPQAYGIHNLNMNGYYSGNQLIGFPIYDLSTAKKTGPIRMPENGFVCVKAPSAGDVSFTAITFTSEQPTTVYFFDERDY